MAIPERGGKILIVDDDPDIQRVLSRMLQPEGYRIFQAGDGEEGLAVAQAEQPDVILLDVVMPKLNGFHVCRQLKALEEFRLTPVVLITGLSDVQDRVAGILAGADDFLSKPFEQTELLARVKSLLRMKRYTDELERAELVVFALARAIEERDPYTRGHCDRLSRYGSALGRQMGLEEDDVEALRQGGIVHDIGKVTVPDAILKKDGRLTHTEREVMQTHPEAGVQICQPLRTFHKVIPIIRSHHERLNGTGYPDGLEGDEIPITARILSVVDVFDALTTDRPYRHASSTEIALEIIGEEVDRGWWDPGVFAEFRILIEEGLLEGPEEGIAPSEEPEA
ncbi:HD-GYP domain-containing protein [Gemmatimonadota bacterium]